ncbi:DUF5714 domain-containing protein [Chloroflexota bacterium]
MSTDAQNQPGLKSKDNCGVCGKLLIYQTETISMDCAFCKQEHTTNIYCPDEHYICDSCHESETLDILKQVISSSSTADPSEILEIVMSHPSVSMHGPEHHAMVPTIIVAAVKNAGYPVPGRAIDKAIERGSKVPGGWCGFYGACGAAIGVGIAVSILCEATPLTGKPRSKAIKATSYALGKMVDGYPRCCKRASRKALEAAGEYLHDRMGITLSKGKNITCTHSHRNLECPKENCSYYPDS